MAGLALLFFALRIIATVRLRLKWAMDDTMAVSSAVSLSTAGMEDDTHAKQVLLIPVVVIMQFSMLSCVDSRPGG